MEEKKAKEDQGGCGRRRSLTGYTRVFGEDLLGTHGVLGKLAGYANNYTN